MKIEYHSRLVPEFVVDPNRGRHWRLVAPFEFSVDGLNFIVPSDFWTDFASVPRFLWPVVSPYDLGVGPIPHDFGYFTGHANKEWWDLVLLACMERDKIAGWKAQAAYRAVSWFWGSVWRGYRRQNSKHVLTTNRLNQMEVLNWGLRHHAGGSSSPEKLSGEQAAWLGAVTVATGV